MREGVHSGSLWAVARTPLFCSHFHKAWRGVWRSYIGVADRAGEGVPSGCPCRGPAATGSIAWKTGCRGLLSSSSGCRRGSTIHLSSCCEAERHGSGDPTPCGGYPGPGCSASFYHLPNVYWSSINLRFSLIDHVDIIRIQICLLLLNHALVYMKYNEGIRGYDVSSH